MRKGQRASSSSESGEDQRPRSEDSKDRSSPRGCSSDEVASSDSDAEAERVMKRSQGFSSSFSFGEDNQPLPKREEGEEEEEVPPNNSNGVPVAELTEAELVEELEERDAYCATGRPPRSALFRPQALWLAITRCLSLRWPPCLSINRQNDGKLAYQVDLDQSENTQSSVSSETTNESSSSTSTSDDRDVTPVKHKEEEVRSRGVKTGPAPRPGISYSSPRLPRARQATDLFLASMILEKETFLRIELVDAGDEKEDLRYRAEWKLSERTKELAEGVWLSRSQKMMD